MGKSACWEDGGRSTCLLPDGHEGPHEFTPDDQITVRFANADDAVAWLKDEGPAGEIEYRCPLCWASFPDREELAQHEAMERMVDWPLDREEVGRGSQEHPRRLLGGRVRPRQP